MQEEPNIKLVSVRFFKMKVFLVVFLSAACFLQAKALCVNEFDEVEKKCAEPLKLTKDHVFDAYTQSVYPDGNKDHFIRYIGCVFRGWGYQDEVGNFNFDKMKQSIDFPWKIGKICNDEFDMPHGYDPKEDTISYCAKHLPPADQPLDTAAEKVRECLVSKYAELKH